MTKIILLHMYKIRNYYDSALLVFLVISQQRFSQLSCSLVVVIIISTSP